MTNSAFWRAVHSLTHPMSILAVLLLLFNDHYLRHVSPSWITGKLGDFTWLIFAPFIVGLLFAWLIPRRLQQHERVVGIASIGFIGIWFATAKTIPLVHEWTTSTLDYIVGWEGSLRLDASDLLTLPALLISWHIWRHASNTSPNFKAYAPIIFGLAIMGTLATSYAPPNHGVFCVYEEEGALFLEISNNNFRYTSVDGGLTWQVSTSRLPCDVWSWEFSGIDSRILIDERSEIQYRINIGQSVEVSENDGVTWFNEMDLSFLYNDLRQIYIQTYYDVPDNGTPRSPLDAVIDSGTGNLVLAMGYDGILVRTPDAQWQWVAVGDFSFRETEDMNPFKILSFEIFASIVLGLIFLAVPLKSKRNIGFFVIVGLLWGISVFFYHPVIPASTGQAPSLIDLEFAYYIPPVLALAVSWLRFGGSLDFYWLVPRAILPMLFASIITGLCFLLPYILWAEGHIPVYTTAKAFGIFLGIASVLANSRSINRRFRELYLRREKHQKDQKVFKRIDQTVDPFDPE